MKNVGLSLLLVLCASTVNAQEGTGFSGSDDKAFIIPEPPAQIQLEKPARVRSTSVQKSAAPVYTVGATNVLMLKSTFYTSAKDSDRSATVSDAAFRKLLADVAEHENTWGSYLANGKAKIQNDTALWSLYVNEKAEEPIIKIDFLKQAWIEAWAFYAQSQNISYIVPDRQQSTDKLVQLHEVIVVIDKRDGDHAVFFLPSLLNNVIEDHAYQNSWFMVSDEITMNRNFIHHLYQTAELFNDEDQYKPYQPLQKQGEKVKEFGKKYPKTYTGMAELVNKLDDEYRYTWYSKNNVFDGMISKMSSDKSFNRHIWNDWMWQVFIGRYELEKDNDLPADELD